MIRFVCTSQQAVTGIGPHKNRKIENRRTQPLQNPLLGFDAAPSPCEEVIITPVRPSDPKSPTAVILYIICGKPLVGNNCCIIGDRKQKSKRGFNINNPGLSVAVIGFNYGRKTFF